MYEAKLGAKCYMYVLPELLVVQEPKKGQN